MLKIIIMQIAYDKIVKIYFNIEYQKVYPEFQLGYNFWDRQERWVVEETFMRTNKKFRIRIKSEPFKIFSHFFPMESSKNSLFFDGGGRYSSFAMLTCCIPHLLALFLPLTIRLYRIEYSFAVVTRVPAFVRLL